MFDPRITEKILEAFQKENKTCITMQIMERERLSEVGKNGLRIQKRISAHVTLVENSTKVVQVEEQK